MRFTVTTHPSKHDKAWSLLPPFPEYWCTLQTPEGDLVARCEVHSMRKSAQLFANHSRLRRYYLTDVHVHPAYRGQGYCALLLLNVMYHFDQLRGDDVELVFELATYRNNSAAVRAYRKVFGEPSIAGYGPHGLIYFSTESTEPPPK